MDGVYHLIASRFQVEHRVSQEVSGSPLNSTLKNTTTDQWVSGPLPRVGILGMHCNAELFATPWGGEQLDLWPLPTDEAA